MVAKAQKTRVKYNGKPAKYWVFQMWLEAPETFDPQTAYKKYPSVDRQTIINWESRWRNWDGDTFTGIDGFPRGSADTPEKIAQIRAAIKRARKARGAQTGDRSVRRHVPPNKNFPEELPRNINYVEVRSREYWSIDMSAIRMPEGTA